MHIIPTIIEGAFILEPRVWGDERGYFFESFGTKYLEPLGKIWSNPRTSLSITTFCPNQAGQSGKRGSFGCYSRYKKR